ncbi:MAG TPA: tRNA (adenosine(37)-N6)-threonylcarbamoyltransferase complex ATPase subunit type 1 TsaE [Candidatus Sulfotelmatobacter sp.]|jgi:tRNA threonylcarbamoyladenosine biosynthesis protein TsaE|nr:tRNA (adenosine(37)-N6)-threonylcarbamoyltransferase complex ATPase subunit type 1 TsaE [Candidatus Sulfotelmatobacter sp.]
MKQIITTSFQKTQEFGESFAHDLKGGEVLALYGDLGSGKTTFMQGLAKGLGITRSIISPTFIIMRTYEMKSNIKDTGVRTLYHLDLYRIEEESQAIDLGLEELMGNPENIVAIEWPDKIENILPEKRINLFFEYLGDDKRQIRVDHSI